MSICLCVFTSSYYTGWAILNPLRKFHILFQMMNPFLRTGCSHTMKSLTRGYKFKIHAKTGPLGLYRVHFCLIIYAPCCVSRAWIVLKMYFELELRICQTYFKIIQKACYSFCQLGHWNKSHYIKLRAFKITRRLLFCELLVYE